MSIGIVCERSPLATALMTRAISLLGRTRSSIRSLTESRVDAHAPPASPRAAPLVWPSLPTCLLSLRSSRSRRWLDSMMPFSALATFPAEPVQVAGRRAEKSPRLTAVRTRIMTRGSTMFSATTLVAMCCDSSSFVRPLAFPISAACLDSNADRDPELHTRSHARLALDAALTAGDLRSLANRHQPEVAWHVGGLGDDETFAVVSHHHADTAFSGAGGHTNARGVRVPLHVGQGFGYVFENDLLDGFWHLAGQ